MYNKFDEAFEAVIGHEGGYQNVYWDRGNWTSGIVGIGKNKGTKFGVTAMSYPSLDIKNLTLEQAKDIYRKQYWDKFYEPNMLPEIQLIMLDTAINSGVSKAKEFYARAGKDAKLFLDYREQFLRQLGERDAYKNALTGWINRINNLRAQVEQWKILYPELPERPVGSGATVWLDTGGGFHQIEGRYEDDKIAVNLGSEKIHIRLK